MKLNDYRSQLLARMAELGLTKMTLGARCRGFYEARRGELWFDHRAYPANLKMRAAYRAGFADGEAERAKDEAGDPDDFGVAMG